MRIVVLLPCLNEEAAIAQTITSFRKELPRADIVVIDNGSIDRTSELARGAGARVLHEPRCGKGNAVRRAFADLDADVYVMADGDNTYDATRTREHVRALVSQGLDMIIGVRVHVESSAYRPGHVLGNRLFTRTVSRMFPGPSRDVFSGYRILSRRFVKSFPAMSDGFEIEAEMTIHALHLRMPVEFVEVAYQKRLDGSVSKLRTFRDGLRILRYIVRLFRLYRPVDAYGALAALFTVTSLVLGLPVVWDFLQTGQVLRLPTAVLSSALVLLGSLSLLLGILLDSSGLLSAEAKRLSYLSYPGPGSLRDDDV